MYSLEVILHLYIQYKANWFHIFCTKNYVYTMSKIQINFIYSVKNFIFCIFSTSEINSMLSNVKFIYSVPDKLISYIMYKYYDLYIFSTSQIIFIYYVKTVLY